MEILKLNIHSEVQSSLRGDIEKECIKREKEREREGGREEGRERGKGRKADGTKREYRSEVLARARKKRIVRFLSRV